MSDTQRRNHTTREGIQNECTYIFDLYTSTTSALNDYELLKFFGIRTYIYVF